MRWNSSILPRCIGDEIFIDLNLSNFRDPAGCSLGLAVAQQHLASGPDNDPRRARVLDCWTNGGLGAPEKADALKGWPTPGVRVEGHGPWRRRSMRFLDLKLVWQSGAGLSGESVSWISSLAEPVLSIARASRRSGGSTEVGVDSLLINCCISSAMAGVATILDAHAGDRAGEVPPVRAVALGAADGLCDLSLGGFDVAPRRW